MTIGPIRVLVVDDHLAVRRGLATLLLAFSDLLLVGEAQNGVDALELCATTRPDVVLMDLLMPDMDGVAATISIRAAYPGIQVIVLTNWDEYELVQRALAAGAGGYLLKNMSPNELVNAIRVAHPVQTRPLPPEQGALLTEREIEVLALMALGLTNPQIGEELVISRATAKAHVSNILSKLGVTTRTEAVALAVQTQLVTGPQHGLNPF
jgi:NarL family two-component system response regulator LiaR